MVEEVLQKAQMWIGALEAKLQALIVSG